MLRTLGLVYFFSLFILTRSDCAHYEEVKKFYAVWYGIEAFYDRSIGIDIARECEPLGMYPVNRQARCGGESAPVFGIGVSTKKEETPVVIVKTYKEVVEALKLNCTKVGNGFTEKFYVFHEMCNPNFIIMYFSEGGTHFSVLLGKMVPHRKQLDRYTSKIANSAGINYKRRSYICTWMPTKGGKFKWKVIKEKKCKKKHKWYDAWKLYGEQKL